jgi:hypothetical protein
MSDKRCGKHFMILKVSRLKISLWQFPSIIKENDGPLGRVTNTTWYCCWQKGFSLPLQNWFYLNYINICQLQMSRNKMKNLLITLKTWLYLLWDTAIASKGDYSYQKRGDYSYQRGGFLLPKWGFLLPKREISLS